MSDSLKQNEDESSFSLTRRNRRGSTNSAGNPAAPLTWQEKAYERLIILYGVSKILSNIEGVEETFHEILSLCGTTFPIATAVLIEKRGSTVTSVAWHAEKWEGEVPAAMQNARESFYYLTGLKSPGCPEMESSQDAEGIGMAMVRENYISLPLIVDHLPAFGLIQLQGSSPLDENDLEFVEAMANLIAVAVDRHYKSLEKRDMARLEVRDSTIRLHRSESYVENLETERELRERFVSLLTHDLRTPLSAISICAQLLERSPEKAGSVHSLATRISKNVNRADRMISDLLDANRIRGGEPLPLTVELFDLVALVKNTLSELVLIHGERFTLEAPAHAEGYWDRRGLRRILENLCNNAIKYGSAEKPVTIYLRQAARNIYLEVQNWGNVIPPEDQKSLFQQFRRGALALTGHKKGWGIGLTLVRGVAEAHGGSVEVDSSQQSGTIFTVTLPIDARPYLNKEDKA